MTVSSFALVTQPSDESLDTQTVRDLGEEFAQLIDSDNSAPFMTGLRVVLEAPIHSTQVLNTAVALSNVVALLVLSLSQDEQQASELVDTTIVRSAHAAFTDLVPSLDDPAVVAAQALICRVYKTVSAEELPDKVDGRTLAAIAAFGDASTLIADDVGLPRTVLAAAIGQAARVM